MRRSLSLAAVLISWILCGNAFSQESTTISIGVSLLSAGSNLHIAREALVQIGEGGNVVQNAPTQPSQSTADTSKSGNTVFFAARYCAWLPNNIPHAAALRGICEYALNLPRTMPNFICDQDASRYRGKNKVPFDLLTALIRYEDGRESYEEIKLNGKPAPKAITNTPGLWSTGQFGANLRSIFDWGNLAVFEFDKEDKLGEHAVWVFTYRIVKQNDPLWRLHGDNEVLAPPYKGELWVDQTTGELLRFTSVAEQIPPTFAMSAAGLQIDYENVAFSDGSSFVLPSDFSVNTTYRHEAPTRNVVQFRNCHKFRAKSRMLLDVPAGKAATGVAENGADALEREREREKDEEIYSILREQAVREDAARLQSEQQELLEQNQFEIFSKLAGLEKERQKIVAQELTKADAELALPEDVSSNGPLLTVKTSVYLVPVSVVARDAKGKAVGNLQKDDFRLADDGKVQAITSFSMETPQKLVLGPQKATPDGSRMIPSPGAPPDRFVAYVFDDIHVTASDLASVRQAAARQIERMRAQDWIAIFTTSGQTASEFTDDRKQLQEVLNAVQPFTALHVPACPRISAYMADAIANHNDPDALKVAAQDAAQCAFGGMISSRADMEKAEHLAQLTALEVTNATSGENQATMNSLREVIRRTSIMNGARSIVFISPGFLALTPEVRFGMTDLFDRAVRAGIVINTLDVRGLFTTGISGEHVKPGMPENLQLQNEETAEQTETMAEIAEGTGGTYFHNSNDLDEGFRRTADAPEYLYVLGFSPKKLDDKFHKLKVTLKTPSKLQIQARKGYYAMKSASK